MYLFILSKYVYPCKDEYSRLYLLLGMNLPLYLINSTGIVQDFMLRYDRTIWFHELCKNVDTTNQLGVHSGHLSLKMKDVQQLLEAADSALEHLFSAKCCEKV